MAAKNARAVSRPPDESRLGAGAIAQPATGSSGIATFFEILEARHGVAEDLSVNDRSLPRRELLHINPEEGHPAGPHLEPGLSLV